MRNPEIDLSIEIPQGFSRNEILLTLVEALLALPQSLPQVSASELASLPLPHCLKLASTEAVLKGGVSFCLRQRQNKSFVSAGSCSIVLVKCKIGDIRFPLFWINCTEVVVPFKGF